jgi:putative component of toxin-antitoxin plasmid stabilization module
VSRDVPEDEWDVEFYEEDDGTEPVRDWLDSRQLQGPRQRAAIAAIEEVLIPRGTDVCETEWGKNLGDGLYELRIRHTAGEIKKMFGQGQHADVANTGSAEGRGAILLRVYFTTEGRKLILLLGGYDKLRYGSGKREDKAIEQARKRVRHQRERARRQKAKRRKGR